MEMFETRKNNNLHTTGTEWECHAHTERNVEDSCQQYH